MTTNNISSVDYAGFNQETTPADSNIFYAILLPCLSAMTITGNVAVIVAFIKVPDLREKPSDLLILNLSITDLIQGVTLSVFTTSVYILGYWPYGEIACKTVVATGDVTIFASLATLGAVSLDRVLLVYKEYPRYVKLQSRPRIKITIGVCWIIALVPMALEIGIWEKAKEVNLAASVISFDEECLSPSRRIKEFSAFMFVVFVFIPVVAVTILSVIFFHLLRRRLMKHRRVDGHASISLSHTTAAARTDDPTTSQHNTSSKRSQKRPRAKNRYIKPAVTMAVLVSAMVVCMVPYCLYVIVATLCPSCVGSPQVLYGLVLLQYCNPLLDPFLYAMTQSKIKKYYKSKLQSLLKLGRA